MSAVTSARLLARGLAVRKSPCFLRNDTEEEEEEVRVSQLLQATERVRVLEEEMERMQREVRTSATKEEALRQELQDLLLLLQPQLLSGPLHQVQGRAQGEERESVTVSIEVQTEKSIEQQTDMSTQEQTRFVLLQENQELEKTVRMLHEKHERDQKTSHAAMQHSRAAAHEAQQAAAQAQVRLGEAMQEAKEREAECEECRALLQHEVQRHTEREDELIKQQHFIKQLLDNQPPQPDTLQPHPLPATAEVATQDEARAEEEVAQLQQDNAQLHKDKAEVLQELAAVIKDKEHLQELLLLQAARAAPPPPDSGIVHMSHVSNPTLLLLYWQQRKQVS